MKMLRVFVFAILYGWFCSANTANPNVLKGIFPKMADKEIEMIRQKLSEYRLSKIDEGPAFSPTWQKRKRQTDAFGSSDSDKLVQTPISSLNTAVIDDLFEGDIALTLKQADQLLLIKANNPGRKKRAAATSNLANQWPADKPICYTIDSSIETDYHDLIRIALKYWQENTCITFKENSCGDDTQDQIEFKRISGCASALGKFGGIQRISIGYGCESLGIIAHEVGHALGFYHEHSRFDRDDFVEIIEENLVPGSYAQFEKIDKSLMDTFNAPYDYGSVMHYGPDAFSKVPNFPYSNYLPSMIVKQPLFAQTIGQRTRPSFLDVLDMNIFYQCNAKCVGTPINCKNSGFQNPNRCTSCICPDSFDGQFCETLKASSYVDNSADSSEILCGGIVKAGVDWNKLSFSAVGASARCYWHITSPPGTIIEFRFKSLNAICAQGCFVNSVDLLTTKDYRLDARFCCNENYFPDYNRTIKSESQLLPVILRTDYHNIMFSSEYRYIAMTDCFDWRFIGGATTSGIYHITPPGIEPFDVYCDMETDGGGWTVFQRQRDNDGQYTAFGTGKWADYKAGFNNGLDRNGWLGLDRLNVLSTKDAYVAMRIDIWGNRCSSFANCGSYFVPGYENSYWFGEWKFSVENEANNYRIHLATVSGGNLSHPEQDWLQQVTDNQMFTTVDRDNDNYAAGNCATFDPIRIGAWWFNACSWYRLLDSSMFLYRSGSKDCTPAGVCYIIVPKQTEMKLRKRTTNPMK